MAFATSQNIDQLLTRGLSFRLPNNAPISSLYTLYANGAGQTYWSNSINPTDLSTLSVAIGIVGSTVAFQGVEIADLYGQVSTLSTGTAQSMSSLSNFLLSTLNSTITGISTFSTFYADLTLLSNATSAQFSSFSTFISVTNSTQSAFLTSTLTSSMNGLVLSSSTGLARQISTISTNVVFFPTFYSTTNRLLQITLSTSTGLQTIINANNLNLSTQISTLRVFTVSTTSTLFSSINGLSNRIVSLETLSTNLSTVSGRWISSQIGVSQSTQDAVYVGQFSTLSSLLSTVAINANAQFGSLSSISTALYSSILSNSSTNAWQNAAISTLARNLSILTTSSILAGVYDTFVQLEAYTTNLINSTINFTYYWQSSLFISTLNQNASISQAYFSTFTGTAYLSTVSATTALTNVYISTLTGQLYISSISTINNLNSTAIGVNYSTGYSYLLSTLGVDAVPLNSTVVFIGSNAGCNAQGEYGVAIGYGAGQTNQGSNAIAFGFDAGKTNQSTFAIAVGHKAGITSQGPSSIAIGVSAGASNMGYGAVAIGRFAGQTNQGFDSLSLGTEAGQTNQGEVSIALGISAGQSNQGTGAVSIGGGAGQLDQQFGSIAIGYSAGTLNQGNESVALGILAGQVNQGTGAVSIGANAGRLDQQFGSIAIGISAGDSNQSTNAIAIGDAAGASAQGEYSLSLGHEAGNQNQGAYSIAIGKGAGFSSQHISSIIINATGEYLDSDGESRLYIAPIRNDETITGGFLHYNSTTKEIVFNAQGGSGGGGGTVVSTFTDPIYVNTVVSLQSNIYFANTESNSIGSGSNFGTNFSVNPVSEIQNSGNRIAITYNGGVAALPGLTDKDGNPGGNIFFANIIGPIADSLSNANGFKEVAMSSNGIYSIAIINTTEQLQFTTDTGSNWNATGYTSDYTHIAMSANGQFVAAIDVNSNLFYSSDYGSNFTSNTLAFSPTTNITISDDGATLYLGANLDLYQSVDNGSSWSALNTFADTTKSIDANTDGSVLIIAANSQVYVTLDSGATYTNPLSGGTYCNCALNRYTGQYMVVTDNSTSNYKVSYDYGSNFTSVFSSIGLGPVVVDYFGTNIVGMRTTTGSFDNLFASMPPSLYSYSIENNAKVGINNSNPAFTLDISGNLSVSSILANSITSFDTIMANFITMNSILPNTTPLTIGTLSRSVPGAYSIGIGSNAGLSNQGTFAVGLGFESGKINQNSYAVAVGFESGNSNQQTTAVAIGYRAGSSNQGLAALGIGGDAGSINQGTNSIAIGVSAGGVNQANESIAIGAYTALSNQGSNAIAIGSNAGLFFQSTCSVSIGCDAGLSNQNSNSVSIGTSAGRIRQGIGAVAVGNTAGSNAQGQECVSVGNGAGFTTQGARSVAVGTSAGNSLQGINSVAIGPLAGSSSQGGYAVAIGRETAQTSQGTNSISIGYQAGKTSQGANAVALGYCTGCTSQGSFGVSVGITCGQTNQGSAAVAIGTSAGNNGQGIAAVAIGSNAGLTSQSANAIAIGRSAGSNAQGDSAIAIGNLAAQSNQASNTIAIGREAGFINQSTFAIAIGYQAGYSQQGPYSVALGYRAGSNTQNASSIVINATATTLTAAGSGFFVNPVRQNSSITSNIVYYDFATKELAFNSTLNLINSNDGVFTRIVNTSLTGPAQVPNPNTWNSILGLGGISTATGARSWDIGIETTVSTGLALGFFSYDTSNFTGTRTINGYIATGITNGQMNFTGQHRCFPADDLIYPLSSNIGKIVVATGLYQNMPLDGTLIRGISSITISESLPLVSLTSKIKDKRCFGVICDVEDFNNRSGNNGNFVTPYQKTIGDTRIFVNSIGEGAIWVCDANGPVENGDYITSSDIPGYGMKQNEMYIANYTVAKVTMDCDFNSVPKLAQIPLTSTINGKTEYVLDSFSTIIWITTSNLEPPYHLRYLNSAGEDITKAQYDTLILSGSNAFRAAFLGCTYHCG
jgi:hypothetical protein